MTLVSVITITRNNRKFFDNFMRALFSNTPAKDFELILVDNFSSEEEAAHIRDSVREYLYFNDMAQIKLIRNEAMESFAKNCNDGAKVAQSDLLFFLNDDTEVQPNWLGPLRETIARDDGHYHADRIAAVGPKMFFPNEMVQHCGVAFHKKDHMPGHIWLGKKHRNDPLVNHPRRVAAITGGAFFIKRRVFEEMSGFDEVYKVCAYEDVDMCLRLGEKNYVIKYEPRSEIMHHESVTQKKFDPKFRQDYFIRNTETFLSRWFNKIDPDYEKMTYGEEE